MAREVKKDPVSGLWTGIVEFGTPVTDRRRIYGPTRKAVRDAGIGDYVKHGCSTDPQDVRRRCPSCAAVLVKDVCLGCDRDMRKGGA